MKSLTGGRRRPSCSAEVAEAEKPPGTLPPVSGQWPVLESQHQILSVAPEGGCEADVHQVGAAEVGVVDDVDVAGLGRQGLAGGDALDDVAGRELHGADEDRKPAGSLGDQRAVAGGVDAVGAVVGLGDDRREGGAGEGEVHLVADLLQAGLDRRRG